MTTQTCGVCGGENSKYKCPTCRTPSCSLACSKQHKEACLEQATQHPAMSLTNKSSSDEQAADASSTAPALDPADLDQLFKAYPSLKAQLKQVYLATRGPSEPGQTTPQGQNRGDVSRRPWRPEQGFQKGLAVLNRALLGNSTNADAVAAFVELLAEKHPA